MNQVKIKLIAAASDHCLGCKGCELACATRKAQEYAQAGATPDRVVPHITVTQQGEKKFPAYCRHCENAFCLQLCPVKAIQRVAGAILLNQEKCIGCGLCEQGCPYGAINMVLPTQEHAKKMVASKCDLCFDRQQNDQLPLCYSACPTQAIRLI